MRVQSTIGFALGEKDAVGGNSVGFEALGFWAKVELVAELRRLRGEFIHWIALMCLFEGTWTLQIPRDTFGIAILQ